MFLWLNFLFHSDSSFLFSIRPAALDRQTVFNYNWLLLGKYCNFNNLSIVSCGRICSGLEIRFQKTIKGKYYDRGFE
jgi:hypothetical protein